MNLLERVLTLIRANLNSVIEKSDDPEKVLRQLQIDMRNQLVQVKTQVATAIAEGHKLQKRSQDKQAEADLWVKKAVQAVQQKNDAAARAALVHYNDIDKQVKRYLQQKKEQEQLVATLRTALRQLEAKIAEVETTVDLLVTRKRNALIQQSAFDTHKHNALIQQRVLDALNKTGSTKAQDAVSEAEARARALAALQARDLDAQLEQIAQEQEIEQKLQEIKENLRSAPQPPLLTEGQAQTAPLSPPLRPSQTPARRRPPERSRQTDKLETSPTEESSTETSTSRDIDLEYFKKLLDAQQNPSS